MQAKLQKILLECEFYNLIDTSEHEELNQICNLMVYTLSVSSYTSEHVYVMDIYVRLKLTKTLIIDDNVINDECYHILYVKSYFI